jgi:hypothetical protein
MMGVMKYSIFLFCHTPAVTIEDLYVSQPEGSVQSNFLLG